jgi:hypothetical protein
VPCTAAPLARIRGLASDELRTFVEEDDTEDREQAFDATPSQKTPSTFSAD